MPLKDVLKKIWYNRCNCYMIWVLIEMTSVESSKSKSKSTERVRTKLPKTCLQNAGYKEYSNELGLKSRYWRVPPLASLTTPNIHSIMHHLLAKHNYMLLRYILPLSSRYTIQQFLFIHLLKFLSP